MIHGTSDRPLYRQLADALRKKINAGQYKSGDLLPSQSTLSSKHDLTVATVRRAIEVLRREGLVEPVRGKGVAVRLPPAVRRMSSTRYSDLLAALRAPGGLAESAFTRDHDVAWDEYRVECKFREVRAGNDVAQMLRVEPGAPVFRRHIVRLVRGQAEQIRTSYYPLDVVQDTLMTDPKRQPWPGGVIAELAALGVTVTATDEDVLSRMPTPDEAAVLGAPDGVPVYVITRVGYAGDRPVEALAPMVVRADRYRLHYRIEL